MLITGKFMDKDQIFITEAIALAKKSITTHSGGPFGAVIVKDNHVVGKGYNQVTASNDPTAHAEIMAIRDACQNLKTFKLEQCAVYTSCEPCPMCLAAIYWAGIGRIVFACTHQDAAAADFNDQWIYEEICKPLTGRNIPCTQLGRQEGLQAFAMWEQHENKTKY